jgi:hypothetical protein
MKKVGPKANPLSFILVTNKSPGYYFTIYRSATMLNGYFFIPPDYPDYDDGLCGVMAANPNVHGTPFPPHRYPSP